MKATCWEGRNSVEVEDVPEPKILNERDAIVRVTSTAICGSDLHLYDGYVPAMKKGDILGHEFMGEVVEVGPAVHNLNEGDRVVVPFPIACGHCNACARELYSLCENSNPNARLAEKLFGHPTAGIFGYSHLTGGFAGGQAEYVRVPFADVGPLKIENDLPDELLLFLSDVFPTGYMGAEFCEIEPGDVIAVWGAGPVGQFAAASARLLGADRVIVIDRFEYRLRVAERNSGAETLRRLQTFHRELAAGDAARCGRCAAGSPSASAGNDHQRGASIPRAPHGRSTTRKRPRSGRKCGLQPPSSPIKRYERPHWERYPRAASSRTKPSTSASVL